MKQSYELLPPEGYDNWDEYEGRNQFNCEDCYEESERPILEVFQQYESEIDSVVRVHINENAPDCVCIPSELIKGAEWVQVIRDHKVSWSKVKVWGVR